MTKGCSLFSLESINGYKAIQKTLFEEDQSIGFSGYVQMEKKPRMSRKWSKSGHSRAQI